MFVISNPTSKIENTEGVTDIKIYPTLTNDWLFVESPSYMIKGIRIIDMLGRDVLSQKSDAHKVEIAMNNLAKGIYLIQIEIENGIIIKKFFKM